MAEDLTELAGLGVGLVVDSDISNEILMEVLKIKVTKPNEFLPVTDVVCRTSDDGLGTYREMTLGPNRIVENIYLDPANLEVRFTVVNGSTEHVNAITIDENGARKLEFFVRDTETKERREWSVARNIPLGGVQKCLDRARGMVLAK